MKKISLAIMTLLLAMAACKKVPEVNLKYVDVERDLVTVGSTTANIQCDYQYIATLKKAYLYYGYYYTESEYATDLKSVEMRIVQNTLYVDLSGLDENTVYNYYYEFHNGFNSMRTAPKSFKTESSPAAPPEITLPIVVTDLSSYGTDHAICGGEVTSDGGSEVIERGICWSTNDTPTINDDHVAVGSGLGAFSTEISGLQPNTRYYIRAYAINEIGTVYGLFKTFITVPVPGGGGDAPTGAINGLFTINENGDQVYFSQGNLQYQASTNTWRFAENQYDFVGGRWYGYDQELGNVYEDGVKCDNSLISPTYGGWIDLFGWGTSGWNNGNVYYQPYDYDYINNGWNDYDYGYGYGYGYGPTDGTNYEYDLTGIYANADWGIYNSIYNGGGAPNQWRTLKTGEWYYVTTQRTTSSGILYAKAVVNGVDGLILLPDNWNATIHTLNYVNRPDAPFTTNEITADSWAILEENGAVLLPAAEFRIEDSFSFPSGINGPGSGAYWTCSHKENYDTESAGSARIFFFSFYSLNSENGSLFRYYGCSVRLVQDANKLKQ